VLVSGGSGTKKTRKTQRFILVRAIEALRLAVRCSSCSRAPKLGAEGVTMVENESLARDCSVLSYGSSAVVFFCGE
jgi:hypothetical protein